jgi:NADPH:quinone reductase-like Zn-dependent oxidoreductase
MKASVIHEYDGPEYEDYPDPVLQPGEVLIRVAAAGVNPVDVLENKGVAAYTVSGRVGMGPIGNCRTARAW